MNLIEAKQQGPGEAELRAEIDRLNAIINAPQSGDFLRAVSTEAEHQRQRWGSDHDAGKQPADWFWLVGYLAGKALHAHAAGNVEKAEHHIITTAAALANWHLSMFGGTDMRPGIDGEAAMTAPQVEVKQQDDQFLATVIDARQTWINENPGEDGRDQVTPFDKFLYGTPQTAPLCEECGIELGERIGALVVKRD